MKPDARLDEWASTIAGWINAEHTRDRYAEFEATVGDAGTIRRLLREVEKDRALNRRPGSPIGLDAVSVLAGKKARSEAHRDLLFFAVSEHVELDGDVGEVVDLNGTDQKPARLNGNAQLFSFDENVVNR